VSAAAFAALGVTAVNQPQVHVSQLLQLQMRHCGCSWFGMRRLLLFVLLLLLLLLLLLCICSMLWLHVAAAAAVAALTGNCQAASCSLLSLQVLLQLRRIHGSSR
jgi:hypothetical protein